MKEQSINTIKLGVFVLLGLGLLIFTMYLLGKNKSIFGSRFELKAQFKDVNGLLVGNNVRFSGIDVGNVRSIIILNDTVIEVTMNLDEKMKSFIRCNSLVTLGTDGLIGNRVINISPQSGHSAYAKGGEMLAVQQEVNTREMLQTLYHTNENIAKITEEVLNTAHLVNTSAALTELITDKSWSVNLRASLKHLHETTENASILMENAVNTLKLASEGKGTLATLLTDTTFSMEIQQTVQQIKTLETNADNLVRDLQKFTNSIEKDLHYGPGLVPVLMRDSTMANRMRATLENVEKGSAAFAADMEALKSNFLFRRHFKKLEKKAAKIKSN